MRKSLFLWLLCLLLASCARVGSPVGGGKDTIAPRLMSYNIDTTRVNVSTKLKKLRLDFSEYIVLKDIQKNLMISPSIRYKKITPTTLPNTYLEIEWDEDLKENTTYNFNFGNAIADNNEGNVLPYFNFVFSTGDKLDSLNISGIEKSGYVFTKDKNDPKRNFVVGLYQVKDTMDYGKKPYYITKADEDGYFELNNLAKGKYRLIAFDDADQNLVPTAGKEEIFFQEKDLDLYQNISNMEIRTLPSKNAVKFVEYKELPSGFLLKFEGNPERVDIQSEIEILKDYKVEHRKFSDSAFVWFDTKKLNLSGKNSNVGLKFSYRADGLKGVISPFYKASSEKEFSISNSIGTSIPPINKLVLEANKVITEIRPEKWILKEDSAVVRDFKAKISEDNSRKIKIESKFVNGKKYELIIPQGTMDTYYETLSKTYQFNFEVEKPEKFGSVEFRLKEKPKNTFWLQLLNTQNDVKYSQRVDSQNVKFEALPPAKYTARILVDDNGNGIWDAMDFKNFKPAEDVFIYNKILEIRPLWENIIDDWELK